MAQLAAETSRRSVRGLVGLLQAPHRQADAELQRRRRGSDLLRLDRRHQEVCRRRTLHTPFYTPQSEQQLVGVKQEARRPDVCGRPHDPRGRARSRQAGTWDKPVRPDIDTSMPPELRRLLEQDRKAADFFDSLAPSYQRQYLAWIATARRADTRQRRADEALQLLRAGRKLGMR